MDRDTRDLLISTVIGIAVVSVTISVMLHIFNII